MLQREERIKRTKQGREEQAEWCKVYILYISTGGGSLKQKTIHKSIHQEGEQMRSVLTTINGTDRYRTTGKEGKRFRDSGVECLTTSTCARQRAPEVISLRDPMASGMAYLTWSAS